MVRHYGLYANAHRGKVRKAGISPSALRMAEAKSKPVPSKGWAAMIRKIGVWLLAASAERATALKRVKAPECFGYFNNDCRAFPVKTCRTLADLIKA